MINKKILPLFILVFSSLLMSGAGPQKGASLDFTRIYDCVNASDIIKSYDSNKDIAKTAYNHRNLLVSGEVVSFDHSKQTAIIKGIGSSSPTSIECDLEDNPIAEDLPTKSIINIYGTLSFSMMGEMELANAKLSKNSIQFFEDTSVSSIDTEEIYSPSKMKNCTFKGEPASFSIPTEWKKHGYYDYKDEYKGYSFYQFNLHALNNAKQDKNAEQKAPKMEVLYVLYMDYQDGINATYRGNTSKIEDAILDNLFEEDNSLFDRWWNKSSTKINSFTYDYYTDTVKTFHPKDFTQTEVIFVPYKDKGIVMFLFLYDETTEKNMIDISAVIRTLK